MTASEPFIVVAPEGRLRSVLQGVWIYGRHELLYLCWALMEVALLTPVLLSAMGWARYWPSGVFAVWLLLIILLPFNLNRLLTVANAPLGRQRQVILLAFLLTLLFSLRTLLYDTASIFDVSWLRALYTHFVEANNPLWGRDLGIFFLVAFLWWRGISLTSRRVDIHDIGLRLRVGGLVLAPMVVGTSMLYEIPATPFILLFFLAALLAVALTRAEQLAQDESEQNYPIQPRWLAVIFLTSLFTVLTAAAMALGLGGESIVTWLEPLWEASRFAVTVVVSTFTYLLFLMLTPLEWLLNFLAAHFNMPTLSFPENLLLTDPSAQAVDVDALLRELTQSEAPALLWLNRIILLLIVAAVILVLYLALSRFLSERRLASASAEMASGPHSGLRQGRGWGARLLQRIGVWQQRRAAASIRRIYQQMTNAATGRGYPRDPSDTPYEYLTDLAEVWPEGRREAKLITGAYVRVRYGELPETQEEVDEIVAAWQRLQTLPPVD